MWWNAARAVAMWVLGDDVLKYVLYVVVGLFVVVFVEASAATTAIFAQPFGQWWLAGAAGGAGSAASSPRIADRPTVAGQVSAPVPTMAPTAFGLDRATTIIANAMTWLGTPYLWGGCTRRGVDCSCAVHNWWAVVGVNTPRTTVEQIRWATPISRDQLAPGDIVFFNDTCTNCGANPTHEGLYIGDGQMIEAGDPVQIASVFTGFYGAHYAGAGRPR